MKIPERFLKAILPAICFIIILSVQGHTLEAKRLINGTAIELGAGYDQLYRSNNDESYNLRAFSLSPTVRLLYTANINPSMSVIPFAGYNRLGGKSSKWPGGGREETWWNCIEFGSFVNYKPKLFEFGIGLKANLIVKTIARHRYGLTRPVNIEEHWDEVYYSNEFAMGSFDGGFRLSWGKSHLYSVFESWFGFGNLLNGTSFADSDLDARENHFRVLLGYKL